MTNEEYEVLSDVFRSLNKTLDIIRDKQNKEKNNNSESENTGLVVKEFLLHYTKVNELCAITLDGCIIATIWIDAEDLFSIPSNVKDMIIKDTKWGELEIINQSDKIIKIPCHYLIC